MRDRTLSVKLYSHRSSKRKAEDYRFCAAIGRDLEVVAIETVILGLWGIVCVFDVSVCACIVPHWVSECWLLDTPFLYLQIEHSCPRISMDSAESSDAIVSSDGGRRKGAVTLS